MTAARTGFTKLWAVDVPGEPAQLTETGHWDGFDVLSYVALGCTNADIARRLCLRSETIKAYLRSACLKLGVHNRQDAVTAARRHGLLI